MRPEFDDAAMSMRSMRPTRRQLLGGAAGLAGGGAMALLAGGAIGRGPAAALAQAATPAGGTPMPGTNPLANLPLTADMEAVLREFIAFNNPVIPKLTAAQARELPLTDRAVVALLAKRGKSAAPEEIGGLGHAVLPGPTASGVLVQTYHPKGGGNGPFPVLVYFHGGGWVIANVNTYDASCRALCNAANAVVVSVAYRQAPENPFPAAMDDAYAATQYVLANAAMFNGDPNRVAVVGESAGGNLAAVVCLRARDEGTPMPVHQVLVYPVANYAFDTPSYQKYANAVPLNLPLMQWFWGNYLPDPSAGSNPYASPLQAKDLSGLPPATVINAQTDPLQSEGTAYADRLTRAGIDTKHQIYNGVTHEFFGMTAVLQEARDAVKLAADRLHATFGGGMATPGA